MANIETQLTIKESTLPGAGKGLFTIQPLKKGSVITEYTGDIRTWKEVEFDADNAYIYYVTRNKVIDARHDKTSLARYANDAQGLQRIKGITNNAKYVNRKNRIYIVATKDIPAGAEILVGYGKEYWDTMRANIKIDASQAA
jgi:SET domain-containing protein